MIINETNNPIPVKRKREIIIDILRGLAITIMIVTHVIALTYRGSDATVNLIGQFGGITSFSFFLVLSGVSAYIGSLSLSKSEFKSKRKKAIGRILAIMIVYYIIAFISAFVNLKLFTLPPSVTWINSIVEIVFFFKLPEFAEFLISLAIFSLSINLFFGFYKFMLKNPLFAIFISILSFVSGYFLSSIDLGLENLNVLKGLFVGHSYENGALHSFPIFQYLPVFIFGLFFGKFLFNNFQKSKRIKFNLIWVLIFSALSISGLLAYEYLNISILNPLPEVGRFPPSASFIILSLTLVLLTSLIYQILTPLIAKPIKSYLHFLGDNSLSMLVSHLVILFSFKYITTNPIIDDGAKFLYLSDVIIFSVLILIASTIATTLISQLKSWSLENSIGDNNLNWIFTERALSTFAFIIVFSIVGLTVYTEIFVNNVSADTSTTQFKKRLIREEDKWWNHEYKTLRGIEINNANAGQPIYKDAWVQFVINHSQMIGAQNAFKPDGSDIRIVYFNNDTGEYSVLPFTIGNPNTENALISFKVSQTILPGGIDQNYSLYYGNNAETNTTFAKDSSSSLFNNVVNLKSEEFHGIVSSINKKWFLKKKSVAFQNAALTFEARLIDPGIGQNSIVTYKILGTSKNGRMDISGDRSFKANIVVSDLQPGTYKIQANVTDSVNNLKIYRSQTSSFYITYPIYVAWTMDWEGWDVEQYHLDDISNIANTYKMPITHFFNPRIYVKNQYSMQKISEDRAKYLTNWVVQRSNNSFDEIGMHMHMWGDMVSEAGVTPRGFPIIQGTYGTDVPTYAYTRDELKKIFTWGRQKFVEYGLGAPVSYRTGAWMSGTDVLLAAQDAGFQIDSSGRTGGPVNSSIPGSTEVPWSLAVTTKPYLPNIDNINAWSNPLNQRMRIWEYPNNGADSYWFNTNELIRRFDENYPNKGSIVTQPQVVNYLSHPHWFVSVDTFKVRGLLNYTGNFLYTDDEGPVVYATLESIHSEWERDLFYNGN